MAFRCGVRVVHLYFGEGVVVRVCKDRYDIEFLFDGSERSVLKSYDKMVIFGEEDWTPAEVIGSEKYMKKFRRASSVDIGDRHRWRSYEHEL